MKRMSLIILCLFLISACTPKQNITNNSTNQEESAYKYSEENLYLNTRDNAYAYISEELDVNEDTKPLLTKIASEITKKQMLYNHLENYGKRTKKKTLSKAVSDNDSFSIILIELNCVREK